MTSYFDEAVHQVNMLPRELVGDDYIKAIAAIEEPVIKTVMLNTGDREFPDDLREKILGIVATKAMHSPAGLSPRSEAVRYTLACRDSEMLHALHSAFHTLAGRRLKARFGFWSDSPTQNLVSRDDHDDPKP